MRKVSETEYFGGRDIGGAQCTLDEFLDKGQLQGHLQHYLGHAILADERDRHPVPPESPFD
jgi:hypothetical protein